MRFVLCILLLMLPTPAKARGGITIIQDAEINETLRAYTLPLFEAAGLNTKSLRIYIVKDDSINAFATAGNTIYIYTGLIMKANNYSEVIGVLAHETGHISGGHLLRLSENLQITSRNTLISTILGGIAGIATGRADVGAAIAMGGMDASGKSFMYYRRTEEHTADQIGVDLIGKTGTPLQGFSDMMKKINENERFYREDSNNYLTTHPLSSDRLAFIEDQIKKKGSKPLDKDKQERFLVMKAKLIAFLNPPDKTLKEYAGNTYADRYARAIAYFRKLEVDKSLKELDALIADYPDIPFLHELKGQVLFENGRVKESLEPYRKAYSLRKDPLIRMSLAQAEIESNDKKILEDTIMDLKNIVASDSGNAQAYRYLAISSGKIGNLGYASYYMAEYNFLMRKYNEALEQAERAEKLIPDTAPAWIRIQDIKDAAKSELKKQERNR